MSRRRLCLVVLLTVAVVGLVGTASAADEDPAKLISQAKTELRAAESNMQNGKRPEAAKGVQGVAELLYRVQKIDPKNSQLSLTIHKANMLRDTLQSRMGEKIVLKTDEGAGDKEAKPLSSDPETLSREAGDLLRKAESDMHNGRNAEAKAQLLEAAPVVKKLREVDSKHSRLMALETALENQTKTIDKRLEASKPSAPPATAAEPGSPATSTAAGATKLPYYTRNIVLKIDQDFEGIVYHLKAYDEDTDTDNRMRTLNRINDRVAAIDEVLPGLLEKASEDKVSDDPRVTGVAPRLAEIKTKLAGMRSDTEARSTASAAAGEKAEADVAALKKAYDRLRGEYFDKAGGGAIYFNDIADAEKELALIEKFEKTDLKSAQTLVSEFSAKYGATREEVEAKTGIPQSGYPLQGIQEGIVNVAKTREAMAEDLASRTKQRIDSLPGLSDFYRIEGHGTVRQLVKLAQAFSPENAAVKDAMSTVDQKLKDDLEVFMKKVDGKTWPGNTKDKNGDAGMTFFREDIGWGKRASDPRAEDKEPRRPLGVAITGDWSVQERNVLQQPTMYGLPALVAVQLDREKAMGLARVYSVTLRTIESPTPKMAPPFTSISVGASYYIKASKIK